MYVNPKNLYSKRNFGFLFLVWFLYEGLAMLLFVFLYLACGIGMTVWALWRSWSAEASPLWIREWLAASLLAIAMVLCWPLWLLILLEERA